MNIPSRKSITATILFLFLVIFIGGIAFYLGGGFFGSSQVVDPNNSGEDRGLPFFPFGRGGEDAPTPITEPTPTETDGEVETPTTTEREVIINRLRQISLTPAAGGYVFSRTIEDDSLFSSAPEQIDVMRYIERSSGHVYETTGETDLVTRITNTTIPRTHKALFLSGDQMLMQYVDSNSEALKTFSAEVVAPTGTLVLENETRFSKLSGVFLQDNIVTLDVSAEGQVLYGIEDQGSFSLRVTDRNGNDVREVFTSRLLNWHPSFYNNTRATLNHVPSYTSFGKAFTLNITTAGLTDLYSGKLALQSLPSPDGSKTLVSFRDGREMSLYILDNGELIDTNLNTYAEKCIWSSDNIFVYCAEPLNDISAQAPDVWYQGVESYSDDVYQIDTSTNISGLLFSPFEEGSYSLDITDLNLSLNERYLSFIDKETTTFWTYQLEI